MPPLGHHGFELAAKRTPKGYKAPKLPDQSAWMPAVPLPKFGQNRRLANAYSVPNTPAAPAAPTAAAPAPWAAYDQQYEASLANSRAQIERQLSSAIADLDAKGQLAQGQVGLLPGQVNDIYAQGGQNIDTGAKALDAAQARTGLKSFATGAEQMAPLQAARSGDQSARIADVPLLSMGVTAETNRQRGALQQARLGADAQLEGERRSYLSQRADTERQAAIQAQQASDDRAFQLTQYGLQRSDTLADEQRQRGYAQQDAAGQRKQALSDQYRSFGPRDTSADRAMALHAADPKAYKQIVSSPVYQRANQMALDKGLPEAVKWLQERGYSRTAAALRSRGVHGKPKSKPGFGLHTITDHF